MTVRSATFDASGKQTSETLVDDRVCECCPTAIAVTDDGPIAAFRDRSVDEVRDIYVSRLEHGRWSAPSRVHEDGWKIPMCPVNGPALSARGRNVAIAWFTVEGEEGRAFAAFSSDAGPIVRPRRSGWTTSRLSDASTSSFSTTVLRSRPGSKPRKAGPSSGSAGSVRTVGIPCTDDRRHGVRARRRLSADGSARRRPGARVDRERRRRHARANRACGV